MDADRNVNAQVKSDLIEKIRELEAENQRLRFLLQRHGVSFEEIDESPSREVPEPKAENHYSAQERIAIFRNLFRGRTDVYPVRWENQNKGTTGYTPACANQWRPGICGKPKVKCAECEQRQFLPVTDEVIRGHLTGKITMGVYTLLQDDTCWFLAADFDKAEWREDVAGFKRSCKELSIPAYVEISRSGKGGHVWVFFSCAVPAVDARRLGSAIISHTCARNRQLELSSYDRLFPNQDRMPSGGLGNLIALPLQKDPRARGCSVFVDEQLVPLADQWDYLAKVERVTPEQIETAITQAVGVNHPLDISFIADEDEREPWKRRPANPPLIKESLPERLDVVLADRLYFDKAALPQSLQNRLVRVAAFQNPEFYKKQAMRFSVWNIPRIIGSAENLAHHIALPRGCLEEVEALLGDNDIPYQVDDRRLRGEAIKVEFTGTLRDDQQQAVDAMLKRETGVLCAPTAFGKTVTAAAIIAARGVNTLILVHRKELMNQWRERLAAFLDLGKIKIGNRGGGRKRLYGQIDIALMQSLTSKPDDETITQYGQVIVDECHHIAAKSYEGLFKCAQARFILGLTATPIRKDGLDPIIFMQFGPIRHRAKQATDAPRQLMVVPHYIEASPSDAGEAIQKLFNELAENEDRNRRIAEQVLADFRDDHKILVLSERTAHLTILEQLLKEDIDALFILHGRLGSKERKRIMEALEQLPADTSRVILASGKLIGEGFDHPPLDTLFLTMPLSWKGTLQQYAGRLHRSHAGKDLVRIHDYIDSGQPQLERMWGKRLKGYKAMGYQVMQEGLFDVSGGRPVS